MRQYKRRLLAAGLWLSLSIASLKGWILLDSLKRSDPPIWRLHDTASYLFGSWPLFAVAVGCLAAIYLFDIFLPQPSSLKQTLCWVALLGLAAVAAYPIGSKDLFGYTAYAHLHAHYGLNPYEARVTDIGGFRHDIFLKNMFWVSHGTPYGPLWTWLAYIIYRLVARFGLIPLLISYKVLGLLMHLLLTVMIFRLAETLAPGRGSLAATLYGLNPLAIFELVVNGHNDGLAILLLLFSLYLLVRGGRRIGFSVSGLAGAYKLSAGLLTPFLLWRTAKRESWLAALQGLGLLLVVLLVMYLPFWKGRATFVGLGITVGGYLSNSLPILPLFLGYPKLVPGFHLLGLLLFLVCYLYLVYKTGEGDWENLLLFSGLGFLSYFFLGAMVVHRWYYLWPLALMVTVPHNIMTRVVLCQTLLLMFSYILLLAMAGRAIDFYTYLMLWVPALAIVALWRYFKISSGETPEKLLEPS